MGKWERCLHGSRTAQLRADSEVFMEIHIVSSLTPDDESNLAAKVLAAIGSLLDVLPVSYSVRIETANGDAIHRSHNASRRHGNGTSPDPVSLPSGARA
jgi:hypothetical protein